MSSRPWRRNAAEQVVEYVSRMTAAGRAITADDVENIIHMQEALGDAT